MTERSPRSSPSRSPNADNAPTPASSNARYPTGPSNAPSTRTGHNQPPRQTTQSQSSPPKFTALGLGDADRGRAGGSAAGQDVGLRADPGGRRRLRVDQERLRSGGLDRALATGTPPSKAWRTVTPTGKTTAIATSVHTTRRPRGAETIALLAEPLLAARCSLSRSSRRSSDGGAAPGYSGSGHSTRGGAR